MSITRARTLRRRMSPPEAALWNALRMEPLSALHVRRQVPLGPYYADFASHGARLVIEVDGSGHSTDAAIAYDTRRTAFLEAEGYQVLRFNTLDVLHHLDAVLTAILATAAPQEHRPG
ncbi:MAG: DUF559 domain-containing protein [Devosia sp.]|nr:DUF559 domain-containing protein [Devosia sp.]